jgi:serine/threonine-protein kinase
MLTESEKRAATLAVSRYGADRSRVQQAVEAVLQGAAQGRPADLLDTLVVQRLLTRAQADEVRAALDTTQVGLPVPRTSGELPPANPGPPPANGQAKANPRNGDESGLGLRVLGEYRILRQLGVGGMGTVYLGYQEGAGRQVAIKVLPDHLAENQASVDRFYREAKSGALLNHPNIVRNLAVGQDQVTRKHYLVLEYVDGPSAHALLNRFGRLSVGDAVHIVLDIARALEHAHSRSVVHRDIKPDNILLTLSGLAKLADLGLAKRTDEASHLTAARQGFGTPYYMPYEQAMNARSADGRSDIYALGATLYHLLTGEVPFPGTTHLEIVDKKSLGLFTPASGLNPKVPAVLDRILERMMARDLADRYQTASELIVDLERANLSAPVPSFVDQDLALQDPLVRERLIAPAQPTCPDLRSGAAEPKAEARNGNPDLWYLKYRDRRGQWCKARATTQQVVQRLRDGRVPADVEACHQPHGAFKALEAYPEFQQAMAAGSITRKPRKKEPPRSGSFRRPALSAVAGDVRPTLLPTSAPRLLLVATAAGLAVLMGVILVLCRSWLMP